MSTGDGAHNLRNFPRRKPPAYQVGPARMFREDTTGLERPAGFHMTGWGTLLSFDKANAIWLTGQAGPFNAFINDMIKGLPLPDQSVVLDRLAGSADFRSEVADAGYGYFQWFAVSGRQDAPQRFADWLVVSLMEDRNAVMERGVGI